MSANGNVRWILRSPLVSYMSLATILFLVMTLCLNILVGINSLNENPTPESGPSYSSDIPMKEKHSTDLPIATLHDAFVTIKPIPPPDTVQPAHAIQKVIDFDKYFGPLMDTPQSKKQNYIHFKRKTIKLMEESLKSWNITLAEKTPMKNKCRVRCKVGVPCEYNDEVDFRVIVLTMNRAASLEKCLRAISALHTMGDNVVVHIWVDRAKSGMVDARTIKVAKTFQEKWSKGIVCVHVRERNAYVGGQWIDTWRPKKHTKEIAVIVEDDIDISPYAYLWLRSVHRKFGHLSNIAGYTLQMEHIFFFRGMGDFLAGPTNDTVFLYGVLGTWGFAPHPERWREFQDWYHSRDLALKPYVPDLLPTLWYKHAESIGTQDTMWEMWHIYFSYIRKLSTVYCNLYASTGRNDVFLSLNRKEEGLHWTEEEQGIHEPQNMSLLTIWESAFVKFKRKTAKFEYDNTLVGFV